MSKSSSNRDYQFIDLNAYTVTMVRLIEMEIMLRQTYLVFRSKV